MRLLGGQRFASQKRPYKIVLTSRPIHDIAADLAFSDASHFARFFRKQTGTAPHEFRTALGG